MATTPHAHPHALPDVAHAPAGMRLPGAGIAEAVRPHEGARQVFDVVGGVAIAMFFFELLRWQGSRFLIHGNGPPTPVAIIGLEAVFLIAALCASLFLKSGIRHNITLGSTFEGLKLDWPELAMSLWTLASVHMLIGHFIINASTLWLALAVGTVEEFFFRVVLLGWLVTRVSAPTALIISSVVFGFSHTEFFTRGTWSGLSLAEFVNVVPQIAGGFVLGAIYLRTRNPIGPILAHAMWDFPLFMQEAGVFGGGGTTTISVPQMLPWLGFIVYGLWLVRNGVSLTGRVDPVGAHDYHYGGHMSASVKAAVGRTMRSPTQR